MLYQRWFAMEVTEAENCQKFQLDGRDRRENSLTLTQLGLALISIWSRSDRQEYTAITDHLRSSTSLLTITQSLS